MWRFLLSAFVLMVFSCQTAVAQKREMRGVWLTTFSNIDWPQRNQTPYQQQQAFVQLLEMYQSIGLNTVYLQIRSQSDALYPSELEPWSADITGTQGKAPEPFWDPLKFAIEECRKRAMELHAWINPYRAVANTGALPYFSQNHIAKTNPTWLLGNGTLRVLNPAKQEVRDHIKKVIADILNRYDVDGIHFDDYFYPEGNLNDQSDFIANNRGFSNKADWRRDNVNLLIREVSNLINSTKPWVKFGVSPTGIYMNSSNPQLGTNTTGLQHYSELYCDSRKWLNEGWVDYIAPQVYWHYTQPGSPFRDVTPWWNQQAAKRMIYIGIGGYKVGVWPGWGSSSEIPNQIKLALRSGYSNIRGVSFYNTASLLENRLGFRDSVAKWFRQPVLQPLMPWRDSIPPPAPENLSAQLNNGVIQLNWVPIRLTAAPADDIRYNAVYRSSTYPVTLHPHHLIKVIPAGNHFTDSTVTVFDSTYYYMITALDRLHNESAPTNIASTIRRDLPIVQVRIYKDERGKYVLRWTDSKPLNATRYVLERSSNNHQFESFLDLGATGPISLPQLDTIQSSTWFRLRREGTDVTSFSEAYYYRKAETSPTIATQQEPPVIAKVEHPPVVQQEVKTVPSDENLISKVDPQIPPSKFEPKDSTATNPIPKPTLPVQQPMVTNIHEPPVTTGKITKPVDALVTGNSLRINILVVGEVHYSLSDAEGKLITSGKIWSRSPSAYATIPSSNNLPPGKYRLDMKFGEDVDGWVFTVK